MSHFEVIKMLPTQGLVEVWCLLLCLVGPGIGLNESQLTRRNKDLLHLKYKPIVYSQDDDQRAPRDLVYEAMKVNSK